MSTGLVNNFVKLFKLDKVIKINGELYLNLPVSRRAVNSLRSAALQWFCDDDGNGE